MATYTFDETASPAVSVTLLGTTYSAIVTIAGTEPARTVSPGEVFAGITSIDPPTVEAEDQETLYRLAIRACLAAIESSGVEITPSLVGHLSYRVSFAIRGALLQAVEEGEIDDA
jgi:hypothetical protein